MSYKLQRTEKKVLCSYYQGRLEKGLTFLETALNEIIFTKYRFSFITNFYSIGLKGKMKTFNHDYGLYWTKIFVHWKEDGIQSD